MVVRANPYQRRISFFNQHKVVILQVVTGLGIFDIDDHTKYVSNSSH